MTSGEANCFKLLDDYTRVIHGCFLTEFDPKGKGEGSYLCCLRHLGTEIDGPNRYACKYVTMGADQAESILSSQCLPAYVAEILDEELPGVVEAIKFCWLEASS